MKINLDLNKDFGTFNKDDGHMQDDIPLIVKEICKDFTEYDVVLDCGAHIGETALFCGKALVFAFEPHLPNYHTLCRNIRENKQKIIPMCVALSDKVFDYKTKEGMPTGMSEVIKTKGSTRKTAIGDKLFHIIEPMKIRLIKIDCESSTDNALRGLRETIIKHKPLLIIEVNHGCEETIKEMNYKIIKRKGDNIICGPLSQ